MVQLMEFRENGTTHGKLDGLFDLISLVKQDGSSLGYSGIFFMMK